MLQSECKQIHNITINTIIHQTQPINSPKLMFRRLSEAFIRISWYSVLPILDMTGRTQSRLRPLSWHGIFQSVKNRKNWVPAFNFFLWRPLIEVETSIYVN